MRLPLFFTGTSSLISSLFSRSIPFSLSAPLLSSFAPLAHLSCPACPFLPPALVSNDKWAGFSRGSRRGASILHNLPQMRQGKNLPQLSALRTLKLGRRYHAAATAADPTISGCSPFTHPSVPFLFCPSPLLSPLSLSRTPLCSLRRAYLLSLLPISSLIPFSPFLPLFFSLLSPLPLISPTLSCFIFVRREGEGEREGERESEEEGE